MPLKVLPDGAAPAEGVSLKRALWILSLSNHPQDRILARAGDIGRET